MPRRTTPGAGQLGLRGGAIGALIVTLAGGLVVGLQPSPAGASDASKAATYRPMTRYWPGKTFVDTHGRTWHSDRVLRPGGQVQHHKNMALLRHHPLFRLGRVGTTSYRVPVAGAGSYRIDIRYLVCVSGKCKIQQKSNYVTTAGATHLLVKQPSAARTYGTSTIVISKSTKSPNSIIAPTRKSNGSLSAPSTSSSSSSTLSTARTPAASPTTTTPTAGSASSAAPTTLSASAATAVQIPQNIVSSSSIWRQDISQAPLAANSAAMAQNLAAQVKDNYGGVAAFNAYDYNTSFYSVSAAQATTTLRFSNCQNKSYTPSGLFGAGGQFVDVPIPTNALVATGNDGELTIYRPSTDQLWDFWKAGKDAHGWYACWGGRIDKVSQSDGIFKNGFGASATGLASELGAISLGDVNRGVINHAVALAVISPAAWYNFSWPAQRSDGPGSSSDTSAIPEGSRLRLNPSINVDALHLTPLAKMIAKAAQKYGFIVTDKSGAVAVGTESGRPTSQITGSDNPWVKILGGTPPYSVMANFPWSGVQVLPKDYGKH